MHLLSKVTSSRNFKVTYFDCHIQTDENTKVSAVSREADKPSNKRIRISLGLKFLL